MQKYDKNKFTIISYFLVGLYFFLCKIDYKSRVVNFIAFNFLFIIYEIIKLFLAKVNAFIALFNTILILTLIENRVEGNQYYRVIFNAIITGIRVD